MDRRVDCDYEEMDVEDVLTLMNNKVEEINWRKRSQKQLSKIHKMEAKIMSDIETALMKLSGCVEEKRAKIFKGSRPYCQAYESVQQYVDDRKKAISGLLSDVKTMRMEAEKKEKILRESAKAMDTGEIRANEVVERKAKHAICQVEVLNNKNNVNDKKLNVKKWRSRKPKSTPDVDTLKQKYIKCHEEADFCFNATLWSAEASLNAAKEVTQDFALERGVQGVTTPTQILTPKQETETFVISTEPKGRIDYKCCFGAHDFEDFMHVTSSTNTSILTNASAGFSEDLISISESDIDSLEGTDLRAQGDSALCHQKVVSSHAGPNYSHGELKGGKNGFVEISFTDLPGVILDS